MMMYEFHMPSWCIANSDNHWGCARRGDICDVRLRIVCLEHTLSFSTRAPAQSLITANQRRTLYFKYQPCVEDLGSPAVDGLRTNNVVIDNLYLIIKTQPLLANLKALNFKQRNHWNQSRFSNPLKIISRYQHLQILHFFYKIPGLQRYQSATDALKVLRKSWSHVFCQQQLMIVLAAWWSLHYINTFWRTFTAYIERMIDR